MLVALVKHFVPQVARFGTYFIALELFKDSLSGSPLFWWASLIAKVSFDHLFLKKAPFTELLAGASWHGIICSLDIGGGAHKDIAPFIELCRVDGMF